jgi:hypothetical protein
MHASTTYGHHYTARNGAALGARVPFEVIPAARVLRWTPEQTARFELSRDSQNLRCAEERYASARAQLGKANRSPFRAYRQAEAMRAINGARASLRRAKAAYAASLAAVAALQN